MAIDDRFVYSAAEVPIGGRSGQILTKIAGANYYCAWRDAADIDTIAFLLTKIESLEARIEALEP